MRIRGNEAYAILRNRKFENNPYASHAGRSLGFLGEAAIAFMGEIPEAQEWFDYVVRVFFAIYPAWGKDPRRMGGGTCLLDELYESGLLVCRCFAGSDGS